MRTATVRKRCRAALAVVGLALVTGCDTEPVQPGQPGAVRADAIRTTPNDQPSDWFVERAAELGLDFVHFSGAAGDFYYPESLPPGVGLFDYDNDGDLDAFIVQGQILGTERTIEEALVPPPATPLVGRLYRNDLPPDGGDSGAWRFVDVTETSGLTADGYGLGVATGDVDNDGWIDLFVTNFGSDQLFRNNGDGTFSDVAQASGLGQSGEFGVSSAFVDYDRDGWLDLYVGNNVNYTLAGEVECPNTMGARDYCPPAAYGGTPDRLYRNRGDGTFEDVSGTALRHASSGAVARATRGEFGPALGVVAADFNDDGWPDIYVANDGTENLLWVNQGDGTLRDQALLSGAALSESGTTEASMGLGVGDFDNDGDEDLFMTHLTTEGNNLYVNAGGGVFRDLSAPSGLGWTSLSYTGWGTDFIDFDNDGWLDILTVNGTVIALEGRGDEPFPYDQPNMLYRNLGDGRFEDVTDQAGAAFDLSEVGRGAAFGDVDNDGDVDVLIGNTNGPVRLLVNAIGNRQHWLGLRLVAPAPESAPTGRDMLGARVEVLRAGAPTLRRRAHTDGSYASANDPRVLVGLGASAETPQVRVRWPSGREEVWDDVPIDRYTTLVEGQGSVLGG